MNRASATTSSLLRVSASVSTSISRNSSSRHIVLLRSFHKSSRIIPSTSTSTSISTSTTSNSTSSTSTQPTNEPAILFRKSFKFSVRKSTPLTASNARPFYAARAAAAAASASASASASAIAHFSTSAASNQTKSTQQSQQAATAATTATTAAATEKAEVEVEAEAEEPPMDPYEQELYNLLTTKFTPALLDVRDVSGGCGSMFYINIVSEKFNGMSLVKQHQAVNAVLKDEISKWHGLQLRTKALDKYKK
ncbi:uncharacterized protein SAPINGB_P002630 [Magnusiomyces paraingens]|uniref:Bola-like protein n=1 Tax=Magnusiomyces paraingens TaxID=2606893 RepID=A0A5E8BF67_9ASCO|nr:uncharacterized protein SAPINGB_P002630 [Saprochaete ingens]VVT50159.1 unnamed protein product [Saprochaete ingens]